MSKDKYIHYENSDGERFIFSVDNIRNININEHHIIWITYNLGNGSTDNIMIKCTDKADADLLHREIVSLLREV